MRMTDPADGGGSAGRIHQVGLRIDDDGAGVSTWHHVRERQRDVHAVAVLHRECHPGARGSRLSDVRPPPVARILFGPGGASGLPPAPEGDGDAYINPEFFHEQFCADLPAELAAVMAVSQRAVTLSCLGVPSGPAGWKTIPSWYLVASNDNAIPPVAERAMAARMGAQPVEIASSHVAFISHPDETVELILAAVQGS